MKKLDYLSTLYVYCLNPKEVANYKDSFNSLDKNDRIDSFVIADFARVGRIHTDPWRGSQYLALQRLTRHRLHIVDCLTREKTYMLSNVFLKFSEFALLQGIQHPFSDKYGATASSLGSVHAFPNNNAIAKYAGIVWKENQSGGFKAENTPMNKAGNRYLRYYLIEAAGSVVRHIPEYQEFYKKKFAEVTTHQHKRALALTSRKLIRLIFGLLAKNQLYSSNRVDK
ncbi:Predicted transposase [Clostridium kluyveri DSM 555]|uniref:Predicted transposase n=2 Tax=Clostridium kluyveri TaxID=1534 RepID=A5N3R8_CLOK5|nr:IS110 family transposase [Clostridium kluyveri]EDK35764.1 Predicted transposase [Clostridium kluyveri DSM 555]